METLALLEVLDRDGHVRQAVPVGADGVLIGRDVRCGLSLDDPHLAAQHAQLACLPGADGEAAQWHLQLWPSINGAQWGKRQLNAGQTVNVQSGDEWLMGRTRMRLRLAQAALAPELPLQAGPTVRWWAVLAVGVVLMLWQAAEAYLQTDPEGFWANFLPRNIGLPVAVAAWAGFWALMSKVFQQRLHYLLHLWYALVTMLVVSLIELLLSFLAYTSSMEWLGRLDALWGAVGLAALIYAHMRLVAPNRRNATRWATGALGALVLANSWGMNWYQHSRLTNSLYLSALYPPATRLAKGKSLDEFLSAAQSLQDPLSQDAKDPEAGKDGVNYFYNEAD